jgi:purine-nucleoside phosphorylase
LPGTTSDHRPAGSEQPDPPPGAGTGPIHLRPTAPLADRVLLPGDPGRALALAQLLLDGPRMFNHHRGLWGYTGEAADGELLTIQSTGMGGPSAAIVLHELIGLGVDRAIRVGTCGALDPGLGLGGLVVAREALCADGTSRALGAGELVSADATLTDALAQEAGMLERPHIVGRIVSTDLFYEPGEAAAMSAAAMESGLDPTGHSGLPDLDGDSARQPVSPDPGRGRGWRRAGALAVEMEAATLFAVGARAGIAVGCVLAVSDLLDPDGTRTRIDDDALLRAAEAMGRAAAGALST